jgi:putative mRNA 3-end processing factor
VHLPREGREGLRRRAREVAPRARRRLALAHEHVVAVVEKQRPPAAGIVHVAVRGEGREGAGAVDVFVTEATFGLPVYRHEPDTAEVQKLLASLRDFPERTHQIGVYGLGKCQRLIKLIRQAGYDRPIWLHGALRSMTDYYVSRGVDLGAVPNAMDAPDKLAGEIVLSPPSALGDRWSRRFADPLAGFASGWMRIRGRVRQRGVELPLIISDHCDWPELLQTVTETGAREVWVTHGREEALVHELSKRQIVARALRLVGREDDAE